MYIISVIFTFRRRIKQCMYTRTAAAAAAAANGGAIDPMGGGNEKLSVYSGPNSDKLFDVFVSYSREDASFVENSFAANLEHGATSYRYNSLSLFSSLSLSLSLFLSPLSLSLSIYLYTYLSTFYISIYLLFHLQIMPAPA